MIKKTISYIDYDGNPREEDYYFNLTEAEVAEIQLGSPGGLNKMIERLVQEQNTTEIVKVFKNLIDMSYGKKSLDGKYFDKDPRLLKEFKQTKAYSNLFMELLGNADYAATFFSGVLPTEISKNAEGAEGASLAVVPQK